MSPDPQFFARALADSDPAVAAALAGETVRQRDRIELIASENIVSRAVLDALGHPIVNKTLEGYPGRRFHGGGEWVDVIERTAMERACELFDCAHANVQPHSGTQANQAVFFATLSPGDTVLSMDLAAGGHLSHGSKANQSGRWFNVHHYGVAAESGQIDYGEAARVAAQTKPKLLVAGGSAYPRQIDFARLAGIARDAGALFLVDMAHIAGLVAGGAHPSPIPHADIVTCTTTKTLRGPRGGLILSRDASWQKRFESAIFPGVQGSLHTQILATKAVCPGEALQPSFKIYAEQVVANARTLGEVLRQCGIDLVSGGTDTHLLLLNLASTGLSGALGEQRLADGHITSNKNPVPFDATRPTEWRGLRLGVSAVTTRGMTESDMASLGSVVADLLLAPQDTLSGAVTKAKTRVAALCEAHPVYP
ncbi:MAG: serine hydroxymethyltransferase [Pseudomonadota bacterium]